MSVPYYVEVRNCIEEVEDPGMQMLLKALYLFGAKISEMTGEKYPKDKQAPQEILGPKGTNLDLYEFVLPNHKSIENAEALTLDNYSVVKAARTAESFNEVEDTIKFAVFRLKFEEGRTEKNEERGRYVALPISSKYEPWTKGLCKYFIDKGNNYVFQFKRQNALGYVKSKKVFERLTYPIEYTLYGNTVDYQKPLVMDGLRLVRMVELLTKYRFDLWDMDAYGIKRLRNKGVHGQVLDVGKKYSHPWERYIMKLFKRNIAYKCKKCGYVEFSE